MPTTRETVLAALQARLQPLAALTLPDNVLPERFPTAGLIILRNGQTGEPGVTLSSNWVDIQGEFGDCRLARRF